MSKYILYVAIALLIVGCAPQRRLARIVDNHPELLELDTINVSGSILIPADSASVEIAPGVISITSNEELEPLEVAVPGARARLTFNKRSGGKLSIIKYPDTLRFSRDTVLPTIKIEQQARRSARDLHDTLNTFKSILSLIVTLYILYLLKKWLLD